MGQEARCPSDGWSPTSGRLGENSAETNQVVEVIASIAAQTNLELANATATATGDIAQRIEGMQGATQQQLTDASGQTDRISSGLQETAGATASAAAAARGTATSSTRVTATASTLRELAGRFRTEDGTGRPSPPSRPSRAGLAPSSTGVERGRSTVVR